MNAHEVHEALRDNATRPYGPARSARAEQLVEQATQTGDRPVLVRALQALITAYEYDGSSDRMLVPFARVLRMWDDRPEDFDEHASHSLHWHFKWVSAGLIWQPNVPLATIGRWLDEMERRYRLAGYGPQAVHACRHYVAAHVGDTDAAITHFDRWITAERDDMADCEACERHNRGDWLTTCHRDAEAVKTWQAVTDGHLVCAEEPHRVLAKTLLPLLRLGRADQARANHLRGYRMVRGNPNLRSSVGQHLEFAALTGNEGRALEILADHATWLALGADEPVRHRLFFLEAVVVLLRRLVALGQAGLELPTPRGETPTTTVAVLLPAVEAEVDAIVATFDERNGTTSVSERSVARRAQEPFLASLPLGVRAAPVVSVPAPPAARAEAADGPAPDDVDALVAEATRLSAEHDPRSHDAWERVAATGADLPPLVRARISESRVLERADQDPAGAGADFLTVAREFAVAGDAAREAVNRARAGLGALIGGVEPPPGTDPEAVLAEVTALHEAGETTDGTLWIARFCHVQGLFLSWLRSPAGPDPDSPAKAELDRVLATRLDEAADLPFERGSVLHVSAQAALSSGDPERALDVLPRAVEAFIEAGTVNRAADSLQLLAEVTMRTGDPQRAEAHLERARTVGGDRLDAENRGRIAALLAEAYVMLGGRDTDAVGSALTAAHLLDDVDPVVAARSRMVAVFAFRRGGRPAEAVALLESMLPDVDRRGDEHEIVHVRQVYGECLTDLGEFRAAAEELIAAARIVADWPDQREHAALVHAAANALDGAGMSDEAGRTFERAAGLWREVGERDAATRAVRGQAWTLVQRDEPDWPGALEMLEALAAEVPPEPGYEYYETLRQTMHLVLNWPADERPDKLAARALDLADTAAEGFFRLDEPAVATQTQFGAANLEAWGLGRVDDARARLVALRDRHEAAGREDLAADCADFLNHLDD
jgi:tetratricopeptide (TPR) repeat protein